MYLLIIISRAASFRAHGGPLPQCASCFGDCRKERKGRCGTLRRRIATSRYIHPNGRVQWSASANKIRSASTPTPHSGGQETRECTEALTMQQRTSCVSEESDPSPSGSTITGLSESESPIWLSTIGGDGSGGYGLHPTEAGYTPEADSGTPEACWKTGDRKNLTMICLSPSEIYQATLHVLSTIALSHTACKTWMTFQTIWDFLGKRRRTSLLGAHFRSQVSSGTSPNARWRSARRRWRNTKRPLRRGEHLARIHSETCNSYTGSSCTHLWSHEKDAPTLRSWKPCSAYSVTILSCHVLPQDNLRQTSTGGWEPCLDKTSSGPSLARFELPTCALSPMLAPQRASGLLSGPSGELGGSYRGGSGTREISVGQRQWDSSSLSRLSSGLLQISNTSEHMGTTKAWLKAGGKGGAGTGRRMGSSDVSTEPWLPVRNPSTRDTSLVLATPQTSPPAEFMEKKTPCYRGSRSPSNSSLSWLTTMHRGLTQRNISDVPAERQDQNPKTARRLQHMHAQKQTSQRIAKKTSGGGTSHTGTTKTAHRARFDQPLKVRFVSSHKPRPYASGLKPKDSPLRPHCLAQERLILWKPLTPRAALDSKGEPLPLSDADLNRILSVMVRAYMPGTLSGFGTGLLTWHVYCDKKRVPEEQRAPASQTLLSGFLATLAGAYAGSSIANYLYGIRAWHILHGVRWVVNDDEMKILLRAVEREEPTSARRKKRLPYTIEFLTQVRDHLDLAAPLDAAVWACVTTGFYSVARIGELTVRTLLSFDPDIHVKRSDWRIETDRNGLAQTTFFIPRTKCAPEGEDIYWAVQLGPTDPAAAFDNHLRVNPAPEDAQIPLFSYRHKDAVKLRPLTKHAFTTRLAAAARAAGLDPLQGHGVRIGGTLEYLLRGEPFDVVRTIGQWQSQAFLLYLRKHAQIMAPYMQAKPALHTEFIRITMPPVR
ncbi:hypothetical protein OBBRIDRAFT_357996 [Obba rivulosa]|uniref:Tyr recombinase domain-containing protein n=1 Tax=Obba rivulosa TaxID=1052685 RepID=A0A8E2DJM1_9APHY|nr:hypothetical protein OBBRIDRAFT_357996 [Obba rivulosa]